MRAKNIKWVLLAVVAYVAIMVAAWRWSKQQIPTDGPLLQAREREEVRKFKEKQAADAEAKAQAALQPQAPGAPRLAAAGPAYVAARFDRTHVVVVVTTDAESRFSTGPLHQLVRLPSRIPAPEQPSAPLAGLNELYEPDAQALHFFPKIFQTTAPGDRWTLSLSATSTIPVVIERPVLAPTGCSLSLGYIASIPPDQQAALDAANSQYFLVRRNPVEFADPQVAAQITDLPHWKPSPALSLHIQQQLTDRMKQELEQIDARLMANAGTPGGDTPVGSSRPQIKEWVRLDEQLAHGEARLDYDIQAYTLTPDATPRLFARARWVLNSVPIFLMTAWFKPPSAPDESLTLLFADSSWSLSMREGDSPASLGDVLAFQTVLNQFDADHDGWAELLVHSQVPDSGDTAATQIAPYQYTDKGLVPMKLAFVRDWETPESCLDP